MKAWLPGVLVTGLICVPTFAHDSTNPRTPFAADLVVLHGRIWTVNKKQPEAEALAVWHGRIIAVGKDGQVQALVGPHTQVLDARGQRIVPGFYDSHVHLLGAGLRLSQLALKDAHDEAEFGRRVRDFDRKLPPGRWLLGGEWDHDRTFHGQLPTAALLDKYDANRPAFLRRYDGHMALANSRALHMAGITAQTPDPSGGVIYRKPGTQEPTGILRDNAMDLVERLIPPISDAELTEAVRAALDEARHVGVTSMQDMDGSDPPTRRRLFHEYQRLDHVGQLTARLDLRWPLDRWQELASLGTLTYQGNDWVRIAGLKGFADGSLGSSTADRKSVV